MSIIAYIVVTVLEWIYLAWLWVKETPWLELMFACVLSFAGFAAIKHNLDGAGIMLNLFAIMVLVLAERPSFGSSDNPELFTRDEEDDLDG